jgi:hypothetical protein
MTEPRDTRGLPSTNDELLVRREVDRERPASASIVEAVADAVDAGPTALAPLGYAVDTDALNALLSEGGRSVALSFDYAGVRVRVERSETILILAAPGER